MSAIPCYSGEAGADPGLMSVSISGSIDLRPILILGGTTESYELARLLDAVPSLQVITALAGRTQNPLTPAGSLKIGGFGGVEGLVQYLQTHKIAGMINATHPFAATISQTAAIAAQQLHLPFLRLVRPAWESQAGDRWYRVETVEVAAQQISNLGQRVFLSIGRQNLWPFVVLDRVWFLMRMVDPPDPEGVYPRGHILVQRGPFSEPEERSLLLDYNIDAIVSKNSGGAATSAKLIAARTLGLPVVMIQRPSLPDCPVVPTAIEALDWMLRALG